MQFCIICKKTHSVGGSPFCGFCVKNYQVCCHCQEPYRMRTGGGRLAVNVCTPCLLSARGVCTYCGHAIFDSVITQRVGRRGAQINKLCAKCFQESTPLLHTELPKEVTGQSLWKDDKGLLESISKLTATLYPYIPVPPKWGASGDVNNLVILCTALPRAEEQCYISFYPSEIVMDGRPPVLRFLEFELPLFNPNKPNSAGNLLSKVISVAYNCGAASHVDWWPTELFSFVRDENVLLKKYPSPLRDVALGTSLLLPSTTLASIVSAMSP